MTTLVTELSVGDRFLYLDDVMVTVVQAAEPWNEPITAHASERSERVSSDLVPSEARYPFGRPGFVRLKGLRNDTGAVGWEPFGSRAEVVTVRCVPGCPGHPDLPSGWTSWQEILHSDLTGGALEAWKTVEPVARATALGHDVKSLDDGTDRWQCRRRSCGAIVIVYGTNIYGSAVQYECAKGSS